MWATDNDHVMIGIIGDPGRYCLANPVIKNQSSAYQQVIDNGFNVAQIHQVIPL